MTANWLVTAFSTSGKSPMHSSSIGFGRRSRLFSKFQSRISITVGATAVTVEMAVYMANKGLPTGLDATNSGPRPSDYPLCRSPIRAHEKGSGRVYVKLLAALLLSASRLFCRSEARRGIPRCRPEKLCHDSCRPAYIR